jgi:AraC-like DNA-binding protein
VACGFADQSAFARQFKATVGMTPREFRGLHD